jgi:hypothetical protein
MGRISYTLLSEVRLSQHRQWPDWQSLQGITRRSWAPVKSKMRPFFISARPAKWFQKEEKNIYEIRRKINLAAFRHKYYSAVRRVVDYIIFSPKYRVFQKDLNIFYSGHRGHRTSHPVIFFLWGYVKENAYKPQTARSHSSCGANHWRGTS